MYDIEKIYYQLIRLEERIENLENKQWFRTQANEHMRLLASEYSNHLNNLKKEFSKYNPKEQLNIKKMLLKALPIEPMKMSKYLQKISLFLKEKNIKDFNLGAYEVFLIRADLIDPKTDNLDISRIDPKLLDLLIELA